LRISKGDDGLNFNVKKEERGECLGAMPMGWYLEVARRLKKGGANAKRTTNAYVQRRGSKRQLKYTMPLKVKPCATKGLGRL